MKKLILYVSVLLICFLQMVPNGYAQEDKTESFSLQGLEDSFRHFYLSDEAKEYLEQSGFVVTPGRKKEIYDVYTECKKRSQPIFVKESSPLS